MRRHALHAILTLAFGLATSFCFAKAGAAGTHAVTMDDGTQGTQVNMSIWVIPSLVFALSLLVCALGWMEKILRHGVTNAGVFDLGRVGKFLGV